MDRMTVGGFGIAVIAIIASVIVDNGNLFALLNLPAFLLVVGGTVGVTAMTTRASDVRMLKSVVAVAFKQSTWDEVKVIDQLVDFAQFARREGLLALDRRLSDIEDRFLRSGVQAVVDGVDPQLVRELLETEVMHIEDRHRRFAGIFEAAGGYAPTLGIIGTVMGLVHVLANLGSAATLGPAIATAFVATLYGIGTANLVWLPIAGKLRTKSEEELLVRELMVEGILSLQAGDNPKVLRDKLDAFLPSHDEAAAAANQASVSA